MSLRDQMYNDVNNVFFNVDEIAETVFYNGDLVTAIVNLGESIKSGNTFASTGQSARMEIAVRYEDIPDPKSGDSIQQWQPITSEKHVVGSENEILGSENNSSIGLFSELFVGKTWSVVRILRFDGVLYVLECIADESPW